ncbi:MAG: GNAT family N-acetyltransferase [Methylococcales bacterium]
MRQEGTKESNHPLSTLAKRIEPIDQAFFSVDEATFAKFQALRNHFLPPTNELHSLLKTKAPWEAMATPNLIPPAPIISDKWLAHFDCGVTALNDWLKHHALGNHVTGTSHSFVLYAGTDVIGYYTLSSGEISHEVTPRIMQNNSPKSLHVFILSRIAVDKCFHNQGFGQALLCDAMIRVVNAAVNTGVFALLVHTTSEQIRQFYLSRGFIEWPLQAMTLVMTLETVRSILEETS